jgi:hypothetical protein
MALVNTFRVKATATVIVEATNTTDSEGKVKIPLPFISGQWKCTMTYFLTHVEQTEPSKLIVIKVGGEIINMVIPIHGVGCSRQDSCQIEHQGNMLEITLVDGKGNQFRNVKFDANFKLEVDVSTGEGVSTEDEVTTEDSDDDFDPSAPNMLQGAETSSASEEETTTEEEGSDEEEDANPAPPPPKRWMLLRTVRKQRRTSGGSSSISQVAEHWK